MSRPRPATGGPDDARRARHLDRDERHYERRRRNDVWRRARIERERYDPSPPGDEDWVTPEPDTDGVRRVAPPSHLGADLDRFVAQRGWSERLRGTRVFTHWEAIVGTDLAGRCEPVRIAGGTLVIRAENQVWSTQLRYLTPDLIRSAGEVLGPDLVREVRLVVGPLQGAPEDT